MQTLVFYSHLSIIFRLNNIPIFIKNHAISHLSSALLFGYPLSFFISTLHSTKQKQCFYLLFALFSLTKPIQESSKINKKHLFIRQFLSFKSNNHQSTNLNKGRPTCTSYERILSVKNNKEIIFFVYLCYHCALNLNERGTEINKDDLYKPSFFIILPKHYHCNDDNNHNG